MTGAARIALRGVTRRFGATVALREVDLEPEPGRITALIGPSGCGKSTLLRLVNGLIQPDEGVVEIDGRPLTADRLAAVRRQSGYVIQDGGLFPHLTARENVTLMARHLRQDPERIAARSEELARLVHLEAGQLERYPRELSGGQAQRVALMRALMLEPRVLLLDEPMAALDPMIRSRLQTDLREIFAATAATVVLVTHDLAEACYLADRVVLMDAGRIVQQASPARLLAEPVDDFAREFVSAQRQLHIPGAP